MENEKLKKWAPLAIGAAIVLLILRARAATGTNSPAAQSDQQQLATTAQQLQLQSQAQQNAYQGSILALRQQIAQAQAQQFLDYSGFQHRLATNTRTGADSAYMCAAGKPRIDPSTGQTYCRVPQHQLNGGGGFFAGGQTGGFGTPPINGLLSFFGGLFG